MRIQVVEDESKLARLLKEGLEQEGYMVDVYPDAESFEAEHRSGKTIESSLLVLDHMLPGKSGVDLCRSLRAADNAMPVLMLTARGSTENKVQALDAGVDDYVVKPFEFEELVARIRALARRVPGTTTDILTGGEIVMNQKEHRVYKKGVEIELTYSEYEILRLLMSQPGRAYTREEIVHTRWGSGHVVTSNVIDAHITALRKKIGSTPNGGYIRTVRGIGYAFVA